MKIYINKNNQQSGPFEEGQVLEMLRNGQLSAHDLAIREGDKDWQPLGSAFANSAGIGAVSTASNVAPKSGCRRILAIGLLVLGVLFFLGGIGGTMIGFSGGSNYACQLADESYNKMQEAYKKYESNPTKENEEDFKRAAQRSESSGDVCAGIKSTEARIKVISVLSIIAGITMAIIGFFLRR